MRRFPGSLVGTVVGVVVASASIAGCGSSAPHYCDAVKADAATLTDFTSPDVQPDFAKIPAFLHAAHELQRKAPKEVAGDWAVITSTLDSLTDGLKDAGLTYPQFATFLDTGKLPAGVTAAKTAGLSVKYQQLGADVVTRAANDITKQAADGCGVDLTRKG